MCIIVCYVYVQCTKEKQQKKKRFQVVLVVFCFSEGMINLTEMKANIQAPYGIEIYQSIRAYCV
jgi:hypothetical protein